MPDIRKEPKMPNSNKKGSSSRGTSGDDKHHDMSKSGKETGGNFKNDPERASSAGRKGGESRNNNR
jgi:general stress protein YciG